MKKRFLSCLCVLLMLVLIFQTSAFAVTYDMLMGDINESEAIEVADARLILRAAVGLDKLDDDAAIVADVNFDGSVTVADARLVLRVSVGMDSVENFYHTHAGETLNQEGSCTQPGITGVKCNICGMTQITSFVDAPGHKWTPYTRIGNNHYRECETCHESEAATCKLVEIENRPATCEQDGIIVLSCVCGLREETVLPGGHNYSEWKADSSGTFTRTCSVCKDKQTATKEKLLGWYNDTVNVIKGDAMSDQNYTAIRSTRTVNKPDNYDFGLLLTPTIQPLLESSLNTDTLVYNAPIENRAVTYNTLPAMQKEYVSALTADDVKSISVQTGQTVNVLSDFPATFADKNEKQYDISDYKNTVINNAIKVTITINDETATRTGTNADGNVYKFTSGSKQVAADSELAAERFYGLRLQDLCEQFPQTESQYNEDEEATMVMTNDCASASTSITAVWYFDAVSFKPIACIYTANVTIDQEVQMQMAELIDGSFDMNTKITYRYAYLFSDYYPCMAD